MTAADRRRSRKAVNQAAYQHECKRSLSDPKTAWFVYSMFPDTIMAWHV
jgi:hypothetical protein